MLRHIVMFSCKDTQSRDDIRKGLSILTGIPHAQKLEVAFNEKVDQLGNDIEVVVYGEFADVEALRAYKAHPLYQESIDRVRPIRELRVAADYTVESAATTAL
ncbi:Dabb family protein [Asticcacaulis sp. BYS171W]|uniref:Dabb family protein n=1 Tax=Asticcacaulis aquaticus TaxID=2984212 RepID=A0ABT5HS08_9CAUL|nr:Dabb family protein [Asticcacaulis aquaticus]MDC7682842.1 Dabb family protein [Asticcacaulis aquaticus]